MSVALSFLLLFTAAILGGGEPIYGSWQIVDLAPRFQPQPVDSVTVDFPAPPPEMIAAVAQAGWQLHIHRDGRWVFVDPVQGEALSHWRMSVRDQLIITDAAGDSTFHSWSINEQGRLCLSIEGSAWWLLWQRQAGE